MNRNKKSIFGNIDNRVQNLFQYITDAIARRTGLSCYALGRICNLMSVLGILAVAGTGIGLQIFNTENTKNKIFAVSILIILIAVGLGHEIYLKKLMKSDRNVLLKPEEPFYVVNSCMLRLSWSLMGIVVFVQGMVADLVVMFTSDERLTLLVRAVLTLAVTSISLLPLLFGSVFYFMRCTPRNFLHK